MWEFREESQDEAVFIDRATTARFRASVDKGNMSRFFRHLRPLHRQEVSSALTFKVPNLYKRHRQSFGRNPRYVEFGVENTAMRLVLDFRYQPAPAALIQRLREFAPKKEKPNAEGKLQQPRHPASRRHPRQKLRPRHGQRSEAVEGVHGEEVGRPGSSAPAAGLVEGKRGRGRPMGSKDKRPRKKRKMKKTRRTAARG